MSREMEIAGVVVAFETVPLTPFDVATDTEVTEPVADVPDVGAQDALTANPDQLDVPNTLPVICGLLTNEAVI